MEDDVSTPDEEQVSYPEQGDEEQVCYPGDGYDADGQGASDPPEQDAPSETGDAEDALLEPERVVAHLGTPEEEAEEERRIARQRAWEEDARREWDEAHPHLDAPPWNPNAPPQDTMGSREPNQPDGPDPDDEPLSEQTRDLLHHPEPEGRYNPESPEYEDPNVEVAP